MEKLNYFNLFITAIIAHIKSSITYVTKATKMQNKCKRIKLKYCCAYNFYGLYIQREMEGLKNSLKPGLVRNFGFSSFRGNGP